MGSRDGLEDGQGNQQKSGVGLPLRELISVQVRGGTRFKNHGGKGRENGSGTHISWARALRAPAILVQCGKGGKAGKRNRKCQGPLWERACGSGVLESKRDGTRFRLLRW